MQRFREAVEYYRDNASKELKQIMVDFALQTVRADGDVNMDEDKAVTYICQQWGVDADLAQPKEGGEAPRDHAEAFARAMQRVLQV